MSNLNLSGIDFNKYTVIKQEDMIKHASEQDRIDLARILKNIRISRYKFNKNTGNKYLVINVDESYARDVVDILKQNNHWK